LPICCNIINFYLLFVSCTYQNDTDGLTVLGNFVDGDVLYHMTHEEVLSLINEVGLRHKFLRARSMLVR